MHAYLSNLFESILFQGPGIRGPGGTCLAFHRAKQGIDLSACSCFAFDIFDKIIVFLEIPGNYRLNLKKPCSAFYPLPGSSKMSSLSRISEYLHFSAWLRERGRV
jgi:hypothetical protein